MGTQWVPCCNVVCDDIGPSVTLSLDVIGCIGLRKRERGVRGGHFASFGVVM